MAKPGNTAGGRKTGAASKDTQARKRPSTPGKSPYQAAERPAGPSQAKARPAKLHRAKPHPAGPDRVRPEKPAMDRHKPSEPYGATIQRRAADRIRAGHVWVYASDLESVRVDEGNAPALVPVADGRGLLLGTALYSPNSQITLRMVSHEAISEPEWLDLVAKRLRAAIHRRETLLTEDTNACRLCFSEADELPGLVADKYGDLIVLQLLVRGLDSAAIRDTCARVFHEELSPQAVLERPDPRMRELEGMSAPNLAPVWAADPGAPLTQTQFQLNGLKFHFDANAGQKTGAFLDQRSNYAAAADWAKSLGMVDRALDVCTYQGGFALHLARFCKQVTGVDASRSSLEVAEKNLATNRATLKAEVDWVEADAFELLREWSDAQERFDTIVVDPPAFAKSHRALEGALRGYKELNLRALKMLRPGGLLVTCSCSHHVGWTDLEGSVASAAADAHRRVRILERRGATLDHPVVLNIPETEYLKCLVLQVE